MNSFQKYKKQNQLTAFESWKLWWKLRHIFLQFPSIDLWLKPALSFVLFVAVAGIATYMYNQKTPVSKVSADEILTVSIDRLKNPDKIFYTSYTIDTKNSYQRHNHIEVQTWIDFQNSRSKTYQKLVNTGPREIHRDFGNGIQTETIEDVEITKLITDNQFIYLDTGSTTVSAMTSIDSKVYTMMLDNFVQNQSDAFEFMKANFDQKKFEETKIQTSKGEREVYKISFEFAHLAFVGNSEIPVVPAQYEHTIYFAKDTLLPLKETSRSLDSDLPEDEMVIEYKEYGFLDLSAEETAKTFSYHISDDSMVHRFEPIGMGTTQEEFIGALTYSYIGEQYIEPAIITTDRKKYKLTGSRVLNSSGYTNIPTLYFKFATNHKVVVRGFLEAQNNTIYAQDIEIQP